MKEHDMIIMDDEIDSVVEFLISNIRDKVFFDLGAYRRVWSVIAALSGAREIHMFVVSS